MSQHDTLTRFSRDMDGSMEPDENGSRVRFEDAAAALSATQPAKTVAWFKHGPYSDGEELQCVFEDPHDDVNYSALIFQDPELLATQPAQAAQGEPVQGVSDCFTLDQIATACSMSEVPDSKFESISLWLENEAAVAKELAACPTPPAQPAVAQGAGEVVASNSENERLRTALRFYARGQHYNTDDEEDFDTVSGEPVNWLHSGLDGSTTMIEDGSVARVTLQGISINWIDGGEDDTPQPIDGEIYTQPAAGADVLDAARYRMVRRGQHWSVINGIGDTLRGDDLDAAIDAAIAASGRQE